MYKLIPHPKASSNNYKRDYTSASSENYNHNFATLMFPINLQNEH